MTKVVIIVLLVAMVASLGVGLFHLLKSPDDRDSGNRVIKALTWRIGLWVVLFAFIVTAMKMGWIKPSNSVHPQKFNEAQQERIDSGKESN